MFSVSNKTLGKVGLLLITLLLVRTRSSKGSVSIIKEVWCSRFIGWAALDESFLCGTNISESY